jgi:type III pantothenate kinase
MSFLAIDVGNTRLKWAHYDHPRTGATLLAHGAEFLENIDKLAEGEWATLPQPQRMLGCVVAGDAVKRRVEEQMEIWDVTRNGWCPAPPRQGWSMAMTTPRGWARTAGSP